MHQGRDVVGGRNFRDKQQSGLTIVWQSQTLARGS